jgi:polyribonucleotide nucleotidyltransferase
MFDIKRVTIDWAGRPLTLETGRMARQADGAVLATYGETSVLATVVFNKKEKEGVDFFPLTVNYQEKYYAAGRVPGGYFKREGRPTEKETLTSRLIDRPIRPLFADGFRNETQVVINVLSFDQENDPDILGMVATSAALVISGVPFNGPIAAARVGYKNGEYQINPTVQDLEDFELDLVVAGTTEGVMMVESEAKELSEDVMLGAVKAGHDSFQPVIEAIIRLAEKSAKEPFEFTPPDHSAVLKSIQDMVGADLSKAYKIKDKGERYAAVGVAREKAKAALAQSEANPTGAPPLVFKEQFKEAEAKVVRGDIIKTGKRIDGRDLSTVRQIEAQVSVLPRTHGSALFTRGETQALCVATLGTAEDEQYVDGLEGTRKEKFLLHYNFPPFSVGETGRMGGAGRREIGHGKLAWRAVKAVLPKGDDFPYTLRIVSEIFESNGSSSMATVCGSSLAMMDAGVPITRPVSGIAMGLIKEKDGIAVLSDILGDEDHLGDMDFKVAGTEVGVTSLQMDLKIDSVTFDIMKTALAQANEGRLHILNEMSKAMTGARTEVSENAPKMISMKIPVDKIRDVIGTGGKVIREIVEKTGAKINVEDDGTVKIAAVEKESLEMAQKWIHGLTAEPEVGAIYEGKVVKVMEFGAFVNFFGAKDGLVHVSQLARQRVDKPSDVVKEGDMVKVKLLGFDDRGKTRLSMKVVDQATGADLSAEMGEEAEDNGPRGDRGDRGPRRGGGGGRDRPRREASGD